MNTRSCFACNAPINECMGFVVVKDFLKSLTESDPSKIKVRELCGKCGTLALFDPNPFYKRLD